jgi:GT2 family glycosyltransferase
MAMATAIRDLELMDLPAEIVDLDGYTACLVLARHEGRPVGALTVGVVHGAVTADALRDALRRAGLDVAQRRSGRPARSERHGGADGPVTVAVCTRNRTADLARCLTALRQLPDDGQDLLVVDNAPATDATRHLVTTLPGVRYVREDRPGLNVARNRALREARGAIVAFCDDDAVPDRGWLRALVRNFDAPDVLAVTGLTMPLELETPAQEWFERLCRFGRGFERIVFDRRHPAAERPGAPGVGANMAVRRRVLHHPGGFDEALDAGTPTRSGGDNEMFSRILGSGYRVVYDPAALSWHRHRRTWPELRRTLYGYRVGLYAMWTRQVFREHNVSVIRPAVLRILRHQLPELARSLLRLADSAPLDLRAAELAGCLAGPVAYAVSAWRDARIRHEISRGPDLMVRTGA